jgi:hypothetical protein
MSILSKEALLNAVKSKFGEDTSDETLKLIEDISDTVEDYEKKTTDTTEWEKKYKENDEAWRKKYRDRFFNTEVKDEEFPTPEEKPDENKTYTYEELFKEEK